MVSFAEVSRCIIASLQRNALKKYMEWWLCIQLRDTQTEGKNVSAVYTLYTMIFDIWGIGLVNQRINSVTKDVQMMPRDWE